MRTLALALIVPAVFVAAGCFLWNGRDDPAEVGGTYRLSYQSGEYETLGLNVATGWYRRYFYEAGGKAINSASGEFSIGFRSVSFRFWRDFSDRPRNGGAVSREALRATDELDFYGDPDAGPEFRYLKISAK